MNEQINDQDLRDYRYVCERLKISRAHFYRLCQSGEISPVFKLGNQRGYRVPNSAVEKYLHSREVE